jgi:hypothetical protein
MATYYVNSGAEGNDDGASWTNAFPTFGAAVTAATTANDVIKVHKAHSEELSADITYTFTANVRVFCVDKDNSDALSTGALIGAQTANCSITVTGAINLYIYGLTLSPGTTNFNDHIMVRPADGGHLELENCYFKLSTATSANRVYLGISNSAAGNSYVRLKSCSFDFGATSQGIVLENGLVEMSGCVVLSGSVPATLFVNNAANNTGACLRATGCDFGLATGAIVGDNATKGTAYFEFSNCKFGSGATLYATPTSVLNKGQTTALFLNCDAGDNRYLLYHADPLGETSCVYDKTDSPPNAGVYCNDGAQYDGTYRCSWKITTSAYCSYYMPYVTPWIDVYHDGTSAITPSLETLRSGSTTKFKNDEVWAEWSYQDTSGSSLGTIVSNRMAPLGSNADLDASSLDASDWTGEDATNNAFMKLISSSITPSDAGHLRARVLMGKTETTLYVDPFIRGLS